MNYKTFQNKFFIKRGGYLLSKNHCSMKCFKKTSSIANIYILKYAHEFHMKKTIFFVEIMCISFFQKIEGPEGMNVFWKKTFKISNLEVLGVMLQTSLEMIILVI